MDKQPCSRWSVSLDSPPLTFERTIEITSDHSEPIIDLRKPSLLLLGSRLCLVHFERFSMQVVTVEFLFGRVSRLSRIHFNETKSLRASSLPVGNHLTRFHYANGAKQIADFRTGSLLREVADK